MKNLILSNIFFMILMVLGTYYIYGGYSFPDYQTYLKIAYSGFGEEGWYFTEYLSRYILYNGIVDGFNRVDQLTVFVQVFFLVVITSIIIKKPEDLYTTAVFVAFFSPLFMTTVLRASPLYVVFFYMCIMHICRGVGIRHVIVISFVGLLFHDSFVVLTSSLLIMMFFQYKISGLRLIKLVCLFSFVIAISSPVLKSSILHMFDGGILGAREVYLKKDDFSLVKVIFISLLFIGTYSVILDKDTEVHHKVNATILTSITNVIFVVASTAGIRFSMFAFAYVFAVRGCFLFSIERKNWANKAICSYILYLVLIFRIYLLL